MIKKIAIIALSLALLAGCSKESDQAAGTLKMLSEVGELSTQELTFTRIAASEGAWWKSFIGARKIAVTMTAYVEVGVDLNENYDVFYDKKTSSVKLILPPVKRLHTRIPLDEITPEYSRVGALRFNFTPEDRQDLFNYYQEKMIADIDKEINDNASEYEAVTRKFFESMLSTFGYQNIIIEFDHYTSTDNGADK